jgi:hypothetical protein
MLFRKKKKGWWRFHCIVINSTERERVCIEVGAQECFEFEHIDCGCAKTIDFSLLISFMLQKFER